MNPLDRILHGPRDHQDIRFLPDWVHVAWAWTRPGCCHRCLHPNYLHYITCAKHPYHTFVYRRQAQ